MDEAEKFKAELRNLMDKYEVHIDDFDQYNNDEEYSGTDYYFSGKGIFIHITDIL